MFAILDRSAPRDPIAIVAPLMAIEILIPEGGLSRLLVRLADLEGMRVPAIYVIDPEDKRLMRFLDGRLEKPTTLQLRGAQIPFAEIVAELD